MIKIRILFALILVTLFSIIPSPALAYSYSGIHWDTSEVYFNVDSGLGIDPWRYGIAGGAGTWTNCDADFNFYFDTGSSNVWYTDYWEANEIGATWITYSNNIILDCDSAFNTYFSWSYGGGGGTYDTWTVALHEFGHWLNLGDLYSGSDKVMYYAYTGVKQSLTSDDIDGIIAIYGE